MKVTRTFTIAGDAAVTLGGHNDSGAMPEYGSVYYVDVNVADITAVNKMEVSLGLQTANTWEPQGITVAKGFKVSYSLNPIEQILTLTIERNGEAVDVNATTLVSAPVRLWVWDGVNHVTDTPINPETHYATGYCPVVRVICKVLRGIVNDVDPFGGNINVETKINDIVYAWHYHDTNLTVLNKDATCTENGYTGRTYCETCKSVIDWGTVVEATGHKFVDGVCSCGAVNTFTGLAEEDGNWYYYVSGKKVSGWQMLGTDWYYFNPTTKIGAEGNVKINDVTFNFVNGKLTSGVWVKTLFGNRYYYGPGYYNDRGSWRNIDGKDYYFFNGVALDNGYQMLYENQINLNWYYFNEDGTCDKTQVVPDGFYTDRNGYAYAKDGKGLSGMHQIDGKYYYFNYKGYAQKNGTFAGRLSFSWTLGKKMLKNSRHYILAALMLVIIQNTDHIMLTLMIGKAENGFYSAAITAAATLQFVYTAIVDSYRPVILANKKEASAEYALNMTRLYSLTLYLSLAQSLVFTVGGKIIIGILYGADYAQAVPVFRILVWFLAFAVMGSVRNVWILAEQKQRYLWIINLGGALFNIALNLLLIKPFGACGAAFASLLTQVFSNFVLGFIWKPLRENNKLILNSLRPKFAFEEAKKLVYVVLKKDK